MTDARLPKGDPHLGDRWLEAHDPEWTPETYTGGNDWLLLPVVEGSMHEALDAVAYAHGGSPGRVVPQRHRHVLTAADVEKLRELVAVERALLVLRRAGFLQRKVKRPLTPSGEVVVYGSVTLLDPLEVLLLKEEPELRLQELLPRLTPDALRHRQLVGMCAAIVRLVEFDAALEALERCVPKLGRPRMYHVDRPATAAERKRAERIRKKTPANARVTKVAPELPLLEETFRVYLEDAAASARALAARVPEDARVQGAVDALLDDLK